MPLRDRHGKVRAYAIIDAADSEWAGQWAWHLRHGYAVRNVHCPGESPSFRSFSLHRELLGLQPGDDLEGDHINRDTLDNRRSNLRVIPRKTQAQNMSNRRGSSSSYRGVTRRPNGKWTASVAVRGKKVILGTFADEHEAGAVARAARLREMPYAVD